MKSFVAALAIGSAAAFSAKEASEIVGGLFMGLIQADDLTKIEACMQDGDVAVDDIEIAVSDFKKGGVRNYVNGFKEMGKLAQLIPNDLKTCKGMEADAKRMEEWAKQFEHPLTVGEKMLKNTVEHYSEVKRNVEDSIKDFKAKEYYKFGQ